MYYIKTYLALGSLNVTLLAKYDIRACSYVSTIRTAIST